MANYRDLFSDLNGDDDEKNEHGFDKEILDILRDAEQQSSSTQLILDLPDYKEDIDEVEQLLPLSDTQDPDKSHDLYYKKIQPILRKYIKDKRAKDLIREQVNLFLKEGKSSGRDGRQSYTHQMEELFEVLKNWVHTTNGLDLISLYTQLVELNKVKGYLD